MTTTTRPEKLDLAHARSSTEPLVLIKVSRGHAWCAFHSEGVRVCIHSLDTDPIEEAWY